MKLSSNFCLAVSLLCLFLSMAVVHAAQVPPNDFEDNEEAAGAVLGSDVAAALRQPGRLLQGVGKGKGVSKSLPGPGLLSQFNLIPDQNKGEILDGLKMSKLGSEFLKQYLIAQGAVLQGKGQTMGLAAGKMMAAAGPLVALLGEGEKAKVMTSLGSMAQAAAFTQAVAAQVVGQARGKALVGMSQMVNQLMPSIAQLALLMHDGVKSKATDYTMQRMTAMTKFVRMYNAILLKIAQNALPAQAIPQIPAVPDVPKINFPDNKKVIGELYKKLPSGYYKNARRALAVLSRIVKKDFSSPQAKLIANMDDMLGLFGGGIGIGKLPATLKTSQQLLDLLQKYSPATGGAFLG